MRDIASHIYDITENSINAGADFIEVRLRENMGMFGFEIKDNGCGMDEAMVEAIKDPFVTTRTTRKVGLGIPLLIQNCETTGGYVSIQSKLQVGTQLDAFFKTDHIDCPPKGDIADVMVNLAIANTAQDFCFNYSSERGEYIFDTKEIKDTLDGVPINDLEIVAYLKEMVKENLQALQVA